MKVKIRLGKVYIYLTMVGFLVYFDCFFGMLNIAIGFQSCDIPRALLTIRNAWVWYDFG